MSTSNNAAQLAAAQALQSTKLAKLLCKFDKRPTRITNPTKPA
jgi:hypothetical protein